jgi:hypothetical protein
MVYNTQNYCALGLYKFYGVVETRQHNVSETGSVSVLRSGVKLPTQLVPLEVRWKTSTQLRPLTLALSKGPNCVPVFPPLTGGQKHIHFPNHCVF